MAFREAIQEIDWEKKATEFSKFRKQKQFFDTRDGVKFTNNGYPASFVRGN